MQYLAVFIGGGLGSICRYALSQLSFPYFENFPLATLLANLCASFILGALTLFFLHKVPDIHSHWKLFAATGFCGGFSTFSTFSLETFNLIQTEQYLLAILYVLLSVFICIAAISLAFVWLR